MDSVSTHPDKLERENENAEADRNKAAQLRAEQMYAMAEAVAQVRTVSKLEVKYGMGSVNRASVKPDPMDILDALGWITVLMGCGMRLPEDGKPTSFFTAMEDQSFGEAMGESVLRGLKAAVGED